jgi:hypothetical protein
MIWGVLIWADATGGSFKAVLASSRGPPGVAATSGTPLKLNPLPV